MSYGYGEGRGGRYDHSSGNEGRGPHYEGPPPPHGGGLSIIIMIVAIFALASYLYSQVYSNEAKMAKLGFSYKCVEEEHQLKGPPMCTKALWIRGHESVTDDDVAAYLRGQEKQ